MNVPKSIASMSQADATSIGTRGGLFRPQSEVRKDRVLQKLSMSTEEKVLKRNYGYNFDARLQSLSKQLSHRVIPQRGQSAKKLPAAGKPSLIPPHMSLVNTQSRPAKQQLKTPSSALGSYGLHGMDAYAMREGMAVQPYGDKDHPRGGVAFQQQNYPMAKSTENLLFLAKLQSGAPIQLPSNAGYHKEKFYHMINESNMRSLR